MLGRGRMQKSFSSGNLGRIRNVKRRDLAHSHATRVKQPKEEVQQQMSRAPRRISSADLLTKESYPAMTDALVKKAKLNPDQQILKINKLIQFHTDPELFSYLESSKEPQWSQERERRIPERVDRAVKKDHAFVHVNKLIAQNLDRLQTKRRLVQSVEKQVANFTERASRFDGEAVRRVESRMHIDRNQQYLKIRPQSALTQSQQAASQQLLLQTSLPSRPGSVQMARNNTSVHASRADLDSETHYLSDAWSSSPPAARQQRNALAQRPVEDWGSEGMKPVPVTSKRAMPAATVVNPKAIKSGIFKGKVLGPTRANPNIGKEPVDIHKNDDDIDRSARDQPPPTAKPKRSKKHATRRKPAEQTLSSSMTALHQLHSSKSQPLLSTLKLTADFPKTQTKTSMSPYAPGATFTAENQKAVIAKSFSTSLLDTGFGFAAGSEGYEDTDNNGVNDAEETPFVFLEDENATSRAVNAEYTPRDVNPAFLARAQTAQVRQVTLSASTHLLNEHAKARFKARPASSHVLRRKLMRDCDAVRMRLAQHNIGVSRGVIEKALVSPAGIDTPHFNINLDTMLPTSMSKLAAHPFPQEKSKSKKGKGKKKRPNSAASVALSARGQDSTASSLLASSSSSSSAKPDKSNAVVVQKYWPFDTHANPAEPQALPNVPKQTDPKVRTTHFDALWADVKLKDVIPDAKERQRVRDVCFQFYDALMGCFVAHATEAEGRPFVGALQFVQFMKQAQLLDKVVSVGRVGDVFMRANMDGAHENKSDQQIHESSMSIASDSYNPENMLNRAEFFEAVIRVSLVKFGDRKDYYTHGKPADQVRACLEHFVLKHCFTPGHGDDIANDMRDHRVVAWFQKNLKSLHRLFTKYATLDESIHDAHAVHTITVKEFSVMLKNLKLLGPKLTSRTAMTIFLSSQDDSDESGAAETTFYEFEEVVARISQALYPDQKTPLVEKLELISENLFGDGHANN